MPASCCEPEHLNRFERPATMPTTLTADEREELDTRGFVLLRGVLLPAQVAAMSAALDSLEDDRLETANPQNSSSSSSSSAFDPCLTHPRVLSAVTHVLGPSIATLGIYSRALSPGAAVEKSYREALHTDSSGHLAADGTMHLTPEGLVVDSAQPAPRGPPYSTCNTHWFLTDFTMQTGATRVVPGERLPLFRGPAPQY
jgi:ectoine hydroxylase-related dioxygenase (phytanoyl-CoA dioxygenase family)